MGEEKYVCLSIVSCLDSVFLPERVSKFFRDIIELIPRERKVT